MVDSVAFIFLPLCGELGQGLLSWRVLELHAALGEQLLQDLALHRRAGACHELRNVLHIVDTVPVIHGASLIIAYTGRSHDVVTHVLRGVASSRLVGGHGEPSLHGTERGRRLLRWLVDLLTSVLLIFGQYLM